jgi:lipopolysaccharide export system permease protein
MTGRTLTQYFGFRFLNTVVGVFAGALVLVAMVDFIELLRRTSDMKDVSALFVAQVTLYRVPFLTERMMPFAVLIGAMSCYLNLSRRLELVIARSSGISAWQFIAPAVLLAMALGTVSTTIYNPISANLRERSARLEAELFRRGSGFQDSGGGAWVRQKSEDGQSIINAKTSTEQGTRLAAVSVFRFDENGQFRDRIEAKSAVLEEGHWRLEDARIYASGAPSAEHVRYDVKTNLSPAQVRESFATPESVPFWQLPASILLAENSGLAMAGYQLQLFQLLAQPLYLAAMVMLAAAVSLRLFRFGGVQKMVLGGIVGGFLLYVLSKITGDLSKAGLLSAVAAAGLPPLVGGLTGFITLLYQEDG